MGYGESSVSRFSFSLCDVTNSEDITRVGEEITVNEIANSVLRLTGSTVKLEHVPMRRGETEHTRIQADLTVLKDKIGFCPRVSFEEGMKKTIEYYRGLIKLA